MIQIKKTILTLALLLTAATGAWADGTVTVTEIKASEMPTSWDNNNNPVKATDLPGFTAVTRDDAKALGAPAAEGDIYVFYAISNNVFMGLHWNNGVLDDSDGGFSLGGIYALQDVFKFYYVAATPSGPKVDWDKATKTGSFTMPGGNVTLEPEYYPQAALTAAPTAINDVPATTDGAIVKAGTVANIGSTETAQGTVMYYVSKTEMTDAALLALAADKWTADVPTAAHLAEGKAYVYYYVRGNDSDTDEENFSDGDILAANALAVTIAAEPTYAVTFAEGVNPEPPAEPEWTADPAANVKKGIPVTVTYSGMRKVMGVKAEKKAAEKTITIGEQNYTVQKGETWKQFITRNQLSGWSVDLITLSTWAVYINEPYSKLHVSSDGTNWTQLVLSSQDAPIDTDKQYKWVQEEISSGGSVVGGEPLF